MFSPHKKKRFSLNVGGKVINSMITTVSKEQVKNTCEM